MCVPERPAATSPLLSCFLLVAQAWPCAARSAASAALRSTSLATARAQVTRARSMESDLNAVLQVGRSGGLSADGQLALTPPQVLFISSPKERKVVWAELINFKAKDGRAFPLIDSGLSEPTGLALDGNRGYIYVTDPGRRQIYRYKIRVKLKQRDSDDSDAVAPQMSVMKYGERLTIAENVCSKWIAVDAHGDVIWTDADTQGIYKLELEVIRKLENGMLKLKDVGTVTQMQMAAIARDMETWKQSGGNETLRPESLEPNQIYELYRDASSVSATSDPTGIYADGMSIFWGNGNNGKGGGSVARGNGLPLSGFGDPYRASVIARNTDHVQGVVRTHNQVVYADEKNKVYAVNPPNAHVVTLADKLSTPRGVAWDGDNTIYVADSTLGAVWSMPSGRLTDLVPLQHVVNLHDAYGLALLGQKETASYADDDYGEEGCARRGAGLFAVFAVALLALSAPAA